jgi:hypothetical protein
MALLSVTLRQQRSFLRNGSFGLICSHKPEITALQGFNITVTDIIAIHSKNSNLPLKCDGLVIGRSSSAHLRPSGDR